MRGHVLKRVVCHAFQHVSVAHGHVLMAPGAGKLQALGGPRRWQRLGSAERQTRQAPPPRGLPRRRARRDRHDVTTSR